MPRWRRRRALWAAVEREAPRTHAAFDQDWFVQLLSQLETPPAAPAAVSAARPDGSTPHRLIDSVVQSVCGREAERVVRLTGGGMNETYRVELRNDVAVIVRIARKPVTWFTPEGHISAQARPSMTQQGAGTRLRLGSDLSEIAFCSGRIAAVYGVILGDGWQVGVTVHRRPADLAYLSAAMRCQRRLQEWLATNRQTRGCRAPVQRAGCHL